MGLRHTLGSWSASSHFERNMDAKQYISILEESLLGTLKNFKKEPSEIIFQQDGDLKHTSRLAKNWLASKHISKS